MKQKEVFLEGEGDAWFARNAGQLARLNLAESDPLTREILQLTGRFLNPGARVLEVGCGPGNRLAWLQENLGLECHGIEPSQKAVAAAASRGVRAQVGTADKLPFEAHFFDVVIFGFCLSWCDRDDLFRISAEADRVLKNSGWLMIWDFYSPVPTTRAYHHRPGLYTHKMDFKALFTWNPDYVVFSHRVEHHEQGGYTDDRQEWVATSVIRKYRSE